MNETKVGVGVQAGGGREGSSIEYLSIEYLISRNEKKRTNERTKKTKKNQRKRKKTKERTYVWGRMGTSIRAYRSDVWEHDA